MEQQNLIRLNLQAEEHEEPYLSTIKPELSEQRIPPSWVAAGQKYHHNPKR